ncbi:MAG: hypothetical protein GX960_06105 [Actinomycetales bacterium]|nr:hypothetical protein [Actinomycetales bacterium]
MLSRLRSHLPAWRRALRRRRRILAVLLLAGAAATLTPVLLPPSVHGVEALVASRDLPAGTELTPEHLRTVRVAEELLPEQALSSSDDVLGLSTAHALPEGAPLLRSTLEVEDTSSIPEGTALMALPVTAVLLPHLVPGSEVALLPTDPMTGAGAGITGSVVTVPASGSAEGALGASPGAAPEIVVAVPRSRAGELAHALGAGAVTVSVIG